MQGMLFPIPGFDMISSGGKQSNEQRCHGSRAVAKAWRLGRFQ